MNCDVFLYQTWLDFMQVRNTNAYCFAIGGGQSGYPLCRRHIRNLQFIESADLIEKLYHLFPIKYTAKRSVFAQRKDWGTLAACEALAFVSDGQVCGYVYVVGIDKTSQDFICFDPCTKEHPEPLLHRISIQTEARPHNPYDENIYAVPPLGLQKVLFAVILETKHLDRIGYGTDIVYDDLSRLDQLLYQKGLSLYETWFTNSIIFHRTVCVVNADKYEVEDLLLADPKRAQLFQENLMYSDGEKIAALIFQLWSRKDGFDDDIITLVMDGDISHAITVIGIEAEQDLILYIDTASPTLLTPQYMPLLERGGYEYKKACAISKSEFEKIVYAILLSPEQE